MNKSDNMGLLELGMVAKEVGQRLENALAREETGLEGILVDFLAPADL